MKNHLQAIVVSVLITAAAHAQLRITEVQPSQADGLHQDWWELTNFGPEPVDLMGFKFDDSSAAIATSVTLSSSSLFLASGESIIFVDTLTPDVFRAWWGPGLDLNTRVFTYTGSGLGLSASGDGVNIWNSVDSLVDSVTFGQSTTGVSFGYDMSAGVFGGLSQSGVAGAFAALQNGDIGSPGIVVVPEPSTWALMLAAGGLFMLQRLRHQSRTR